MIWYPYAQMKHLPEPYKVVDAEGVYLYIEKNGKICRLIDSISSWWCMIHGYKNVEINEAMKNQIDKFSHVMLAGLSHNPVEELSAKLEEYLPGDLKYCFFSDSGSVGVEVALKMAMQYNVNKKSGKKKMLALKNAYHGDTFKAMEVGDDEDYHGAFFGKERSVNSDVIHIPTEIQALEKAFMEYGNELALFIVEPLLQGAGGFLMYDIAFLKKARELCDKYDVVLIFDEVATGFGRTGYRFVSDIVVPDIVVLGKGLTGGYVGHAVTVAGEKVYRGFYGDETSLAFMHGPTFMANPLACVAALKSIEIFERESYLAKVSRIEEICKRELKRLEEKKDFRIADIRVMGACFCIEVKSPEYITGYREFAYENGVFARPFGRFIYGMLPYVISEEDLIKVLDVACKWFMER